MAAVFLPQQLVAKLLHIAVGSAADSPPDLGEWQ
jgi:hypothetical protein